MMCECHLIFPDDVDIKTFWSRFGLLIRNYYNDRSLILYYEPRWIHGRKVYGRMFIDGTVKYITEHGYHTLSKKINDEINKRKHETRRYRQNV